MADETNNDAYQPKIPAAVLRQAERAEELARELAEAGGEGGGEGGDTPDDGGGEPFEGGAPPPPPVREPPSDWEQRYRSLQGKYDTEVRGLQSQVTQLHNLISTMQQAPPAAASSGPVTIGTVIPDEDRETYGDELIEAVGRWTEFQVRERETAHEYEIQRLNQELEALRAGQQQVVVSFAQQSVMARLDNDNELRGIWRIVNDDQHFIDWLSQRDPFSGHIRMDMLQDAYARGDSVRTGNFFKTYLNEHPEHTPAPAVVSQPRHTRNGNGRAAGPTLEHLAAPGRGAATSANGGAQPEKRVWTNTEISAFYRDVTAGKYRSREADRVRIEADIISAASEGRVRQPLR